ncbi:MAG TPA: glycosyltransferase family 4 protein [Bacteroidales bacterium]|nr:glycosyltransferase family 4 protein [Bacteroidales bacterium]
MKILLILESEFPPDVRVENEILALSEAGHEVHLACSTRKNRPENEKFGKAFIHRKKISQFIYKSSVGCLKFPFYFNFWRNFLFSICSIEGFDAVHIADLPLSKIGLEIKKRFNTWLIIDLHENWPALLKTAAHTRTIAGRILSSNRQWVEYERKMLPEADKVITVIEEARDRVVHLGIDPEKICIVSNTINYDGLEIKTRKKDTEAFTVFYGGAINRHRGLQIVLEAVKKCVLKGIRIRFWIVGDGSYRKNLEELSRSLEIEPYVKFRGHKPFLEMLEILAESDVAIIPHIRNDNNDASSPNKLYQYMYLNKPIISSDCTSLKRIINETHTGFIYKNESADDLSHLIEKLSSDRSILDELNGNGRRAVLEKYNWNFDKKRLLEAYRELSPNE